MAATAKTAAAKPPPVTIQKPRLPAAQAQLIRDKVGCEKAVYDMQMLLLEGAISADVRAEAAELLQPQHYDDVVAERCIDGLCGYVGCANPVKKPAAGPRYHVSLSEHKVYDKAAMREFCSRECTRRSHDYAQGLSATSLFLRKGGVAVPAGDSGAAAAAAARAQHGATAPVGVTAPVATGARPVHIPGDIMVGQIAERKHHLPPQLPQPPVRPDLVEGHPVPLPKPAPRKAPPSVDDVASGLSQVDLSAASGKWGSE